MFRRILVGVDGSPASLRAVEVAGRLAQANDAMVCVVVAFGAVSDVLGSPYWEEAVAQRLEQAQGVLDAALARLPTEIQVDTEVLQGPPAEVILEVAEQQQADLIVLGARGLGRLNMLLGSQTQKVLAHAPCPVLVVP